MVNNIKNNTISEISAKTSLNTLNEIKNEGITKQKKCTPKQKELLNLFNDLSGTILTNKMLMSSKGKNEKEKEKEKEKKKENRDENENEETLMSSNDENKNAKNKRLVPIPKKQQIKKKMKIKKTVLIPKKQ